jgi:O-antigen ligase
MFSISTYAEPTFQHFRRFADTLVVAIAVSLPWSTSATSILIVAYLITLMPTLRWRDVSLELWTLEGGAPIALWSLAVAGMLWADVSWSQRLYYLGGDHKLVLIPLLLAHFRRSDVGYIVILGFLTSAFVLVVTSWALAYLPGLPWRGKSLFPGVPVKDYTSQSAIFLICAYALLGRMIELAGARRLETCLLIGLTVLFLGNVAFVVTSRSTLVAAVILLLVLGYRFFSGKGLAGALLIVCLASTAIWLSSEHVRWRMTTSVSEITTYFDQNDANSLGLRLEALRKSLLFIAESPIMGHGTGTIRERFRRTTNGEAGASSVALGHPHNQLLSVGIQLGLLGIMALAAMWIAHFRLFWNSAASVACFGTIIVTENIVACAFNTSLSEFTHGWLYVFGVGVLAGMLRREASHGLVPERKDEVIPGGAS